MIMEEGLQFRFNFAVQQQEAQLSPVTQKDEKRQDASAITTKQWILPPPPLSVEVFPAKIANFRPFVSETVVLKEGLTLLKGRVISTNLFEIANTDLVPGKYEGIIPLMTHFYLLFNFIQIIADLQPLKLWLCKFNRRFETLGMHN
jgi:hypothetical protein